MSNKSIYTRVILKAQKLISEGIVILDADKKNFPILFINKGFKKITGFRSSELIGISYKFFRNENSGENLKKFSAAITERKNTTTDLYLKKSNGQLSYCRISISYIPDNSYPAGYFILLIRDITEIRKAMINELKLVVVKATLRSVNDVVFNFMQGLQLFRTDCEKKCTGSNIKFELFDKQFNTTVKSLKKLNEMQQYNEKRIGFESSNMVIIDPNNYM